MSSSSKYSLMKDTSSTGARSGVTTKPVRQTLKGNIQAPIGLEPQNQAITHIKDDSVTDQLWSLT